MINVLMVDNNQSTIEVVKKYFRKSSDINIKNVYNDGEEALKFIVNNKDAFDVLLIDPLLTGVDGIKILDEMDKNKIDKKVIVYTSHNNELLIKNIAKYNIVFFLMKPTNMDIIKERIINAYNMKLEEYVYVDNSLDQKISKLLHNLGMPSHIKGYQYIRSSVEMIYNDSSYLGEITKSLYPAIAKMYDTTSSRVERAIRHAIEVSWLRGDYDLMDEIFGNSVDFDRAKPTNSEFLATLADKLVLEETQHKKVVS